MADQRVSLVLAESPVVTSRLLRSAPVETRIELLHPRKHVASAPVVPFAAAQRYPTRAGHCLGGSPCRAPVTKQLVAGSSTVKYRVAGPDGHPMGESFTHNVT